MNLLSWFYWIWANVRSPAIKTVSGVLAARNESAAIASSRTIIDHSSGSSFNVVFVESKLVSIGLTIAKDLFCFPNDKTPVLHWTCN